MNRRKVLLIPLATLPLLAPGEATAQVTRILQLKNLRQSVEASYQLKASQAELTSSTDNTLQEDYRIGVDYAIYRPRLLHGEVNLDIRADQNLYTGSNRSTNQTNGVGLLYDINGIFLDRFPYPLSFNYSSNITEVPREFASSYRQQTDNLSLQLPITSQLLPVVFSYNRNSSQTNGLEIDSTTKSETYTFGATHHLKHSQTYFTISGTTTDLSSEGGDDQRSSNIDANLNNTLDFGTAGLNRMLYTRAHVVTQRGLNESRTTDLSTSLNWDLGRALESGADYSFNLREEPTQDQTSNSARAWLQHQLFSSLFTRLDAEGTNRTLNGGSEKSGGGGVSLNYRKLLPAESSMHLSAGKHYLVTSNHLDEGNQGVFGEPQTVGNLYVFTLSQQNVAPDTILVWNESRTVRYNKGTDYDVRTNGPDTEIVILVDTTRIKLNDKLSIDYKMLVNSNITYATTRTNLGADLSLRGGKYRLYTNWSDTSQELISGAADQVNLTGSKSLRAGFEMRMVEADTLLFEYDKLSSSAESSQTFKGAFTSSGTWWQGRYNFNATDRYITRESKLLNGNGSRSDDSNVFSAGGSYSTSFMTAAQLTATANYLNTIGFTNSNHLMLGVDVRWRMRRLTINAISQANFRYSSGAWTSDQNILVRLSRQF
ncbi:hypothetical protein [Geomonas edaphica]|uniref:hypothetical protein n=1 Tax=Geomonas edaphica TaxID=2570226 RepID=UPI0010A8CF4C|nr:hypothetical protein [Geomonas edaphica]